jgi:hypothetical protein
MAGPKKEAIMAVAFASFPRRPAEAVSTARARTTCRVRSPGLLRRLFTRRAPTLYQRCLAVHIASAGQGGALR